MPNGYTAVPNVLPGNVTIGGNLFVGGDLLRVGAAAPYVRLQKSAPAQCNVTFNVDAVTPTRDTAAEAFNLFQNITASNGPQLQRFNSAGSTHLEALLSTMFTDYTAHTNTGNVTENTIYSKVLRANLLGPNGAMRIRMAFASAGQGAGTTNLRIKLAGTAEVTIPLVTADAGANHELEAICANRGSVSSQFWSALKVASGIATLVTNGTDTVNTGADQTLSVTLQSPNVGDSWTINRISIELLNTIGPVV